MVCSAKILAEKTLNHENGKYRNIIVRATDQNKHAKTERFRIEVVDTNDPPTVSQKIV